MKSSFENVKDQAKEREYQQQVIARGKTNFLLRELLVSTVFFLIMALVFSAIDRRPHDFANYLEVILPAGVLAGFLHGIWKWRQLTKNGRRES